MREWHKRGRGQWLFTGWCGRIVGLIAVIACGLTIASAIDVTRLSGWIGHDAQSELGFHVHASPQHPGWSRIDDTPVTGAAKLAGLAPGMIVRFDRAYEAHAELLAGRAIGIAVAAGGVGPIRSSRHLTLIAQPGTQSDSVAMHDPYRNLGDASVVFAAWFCVALGIVVVVRGWGSVAALTFGLAMFAFPLDPVIPLWATLPWQVTPYVLGCAVMGSPVLGILLLPAVLYYERIGRRRRLLLAIFAATGVTFLVLRVLLALDRLDETRFGAIGDSAQAGIPVLVMVCLGIGVYCAWRGRRDALGADQGRFSALLATSLVTVFVFVVDTALAMAPVASGSVRALLFFTQQLLTNELVPLALAYTVLRHRVIDLGFVINRTLVFGSVSVLLLGSFGLIEWSIEHWLPESWIKDSVWIDAGAALLVYLVFHRVHTAVEQRVEHVFFHRWQSNEAILRRFVASAPHFEDERALARSFSDELSRFAGEARVALYRRRDRTHDAILERMAGSWETAPRTLPVDDPAFALMRAERCAIDLSDALTDLPGVLALPMLDHGILAGLVLMDLKGNGALYRPDEVAVLGWAAHDVALALAALHAGLIESENRLLKAQLARLGSLIGDRMSHSGA